MPPTVLSEMIRENVELLDRSARAAGAKPLLDILLDMLRATKVMASTVEEAWDVLNESLDEGVEEGVLSDHLRQFLGCLPVFQVLCKFLHSAVTLRMDIPEKDRWLERLSASQRRTEQILAAGQEFLAAAEAPEPPLDPDELKERERRCEEAAVWVASEDLLAELERGGKPREAVNKWGERGRKSPDSATESGDLRPRSPHLFTRSERNSGSTASF